MLMWEIFDTVDNKVLKQFEKSLEAELYKTKLIGEDMKGSDFKADRYRLQFTREWIEESGVKIEKNLIKEASRRPTHARYLVGYYVISSNSFRWFLSPSIRYLKRLLNDINLIGSNVIGDYAVWGIFDVHKIPIYTNISGLYVSSKNEESDTLANWIQRGFKDE